MSIDKDNMFSYKTGDSVTRGVFNVYQAKNGGIFMLMGRSKTLLTEIQISELGINVYSLTDFDYDDYLKFYASKAINQLDDLSNRLDETKVKIGKIKENEQDSKS